MLVWRVFERIASSNDIVPSFSCGQLHARARDRDALTSCTTESQLCLLHATCTRADKDRIHISESLSSNEVSFITSGNMHSGPMMYFARARNGLPPNQHSLAASMAVKIARSKRPARRIHTTRVLQDMIQQDVLKRC